MDKEQTERRALDEAARKQAEQDRLLAELEIANAIAELEAKIRTDVVASPVASSSSASSPQDGGNNLLERAQQKTIDARTDSSSQSENNHFNISVSWESSEPPSTSASETTGFEPIRLNLDDEPLVPDVQSSQATKSRPQDDPDIAKAIAGLDAMIAPEPTKEVKPVVSSNPDDLLLHSAKEAARARDTTDADFLLLQLADEAEQLNQNSQQAQASQTDIRVSNEHFTDEKSVLFFDLQGFEIQSVGRQIEIKKQVNQLLSDVLSELKCGKRIILDTDDGAVIAFVEALEDAIKSARRLRDLMVQGKYNELFGIRIRIGIHYGLIEIDQNNGQTMLAGDGVNDAFAVMCLAGSDQIVASNAYFDRVVRISESYRDIFKYCGVQKDKYDRKYSVYELSDKTTESAGTSSELKQYAGDLADTSFKVEIPDAEPVIRPEDQPIITETFSLPTANESIAASLLSDVDSFVSKKTVRPPSYEERLREEEALQLAQAQERELELERLRREQEVLEMPETPVMTHIPTAAAVSKFAEDEVKLWEEAEQRAKMTNKPISVAKKMEMVEDTSQNKKTSTSEQFKRRKPIPWKKIIGGSFALLLVALVATPFVMPTGEYANGAAKIVSEKIQQPVQVGQFNWKLFPIPSVELSDVSVGQNHAIQIQKANIRFNFNKLFDDVKTIDLIDLHGVQAQGGELLNVGRWLTQVAQNPQYPVSRIKVSDAKVSASGGQLPTVAGDLSFDTAGKFVQAKLSSEDSKFAIDITPLPNGHPQMLLKLHDMSLPWLPRWGFSDLNVKAEVLDQGLLIRNIDGFILGGKVIGEAQLSWESGWRAKGNLSASSITLQELNKIVTGDLDGRAQFQMQADELAKLTESAVIGGSFNVRKGILNGVDAIENMRTGKIRSMPGGQTRFDMLSGQFSVSNDGTVYNLRQMKLNADALSGSGSVDINKRQLSGQMSMHLQVRGAGTNLNIGVGGSLDVPSLKVH